MGRFQMAPDAIPVERIPVKTLANGVNMPAICIEPFGSDHADAQLVADAVREALNEGLPREELFIVGKLWNDKHAPADAVASCMQSIEDLQIGFCPLGSPNRPERDKTPDDVADMELPVVKEIAAAHGVSPALICLKWAVQRGQVPIPMTTKRKNARVNPLSVTEDPLTPEEIERMRSAERYCKGERGNKPHELDLMLS